MSAAAAAAGAAHSAAAGGGHGPVTFNHFYVQPDRAGFDAAARDPWLREEFGPVDVRTTVRADRTYTGVYIYGANTYLELLDPASSLGARCGLALSVEQAGASEAFRAALQRETGSEATVAPITRALPGGGETPWFGLCATKAHPVATGLIIWLMEYAPEFFARFHPALPPHYAGLARRDALTRYAAACGAQRQHAEGLFEDVTALELALDGEDRTLWNAHCRAFGWDVQVTPGLETCALGEVQLRVALASGSQRRGILAAHLRLRRDAGRATHSFGSTTLTLDGRSAVWRF